MLVTELMERGDLYTLLGKYQGRFAWAKLGRYVALDVARGLAFLHSRNIVHFECACLCYTPALSPCCSRSTWPVVLADNAFVRRAAVLDMCCQLSSTGQVAAEPRSRTDKATLSCLADAY